MTIPQSKAELLAAITGNYAKLVKALADVPAARAHEATLEGHVRGTTMSVADLVGYLIGWNELVLKWHARTRAGEAVDFPETGFKWNELGRLAQKFYADAADLTLDERLHRLSRAEADIVALVESYSDAQLYGAAWYESYTMGRMIQFNTASPYGNAAARLRKWLKAARTTPSGT